MTYSVNDFQEGQWWLIELDKAAQAKSGPESFNLKRAVAVVRHLLRLAHEPIDITALPELRHAAH